MAARKKPTQKRVKTVANEDYTALEIYAISLHEYFLALKKAGFPEPVAMSLIMDKDSHPEWLPSAPKKAEIQQHLEEDDDE